MVISVERKQGLFSFNNKGSYCMIEKQELPFIFRLEDSYILINMQKYIYIFYIYSIFKENRMSKLFFKLDEKSQDKY